jgi:hypothetical protein
MKTDYDLVIFSKAMDTLTKASQIQFEAFNPPNFFSSVGVEGYGNIGSFDLLAGAMNFKGYRTKKGKYITGSYLAVMKDRLTKRYGEDFIVDLVDWEMVSTPVRPRNNKAGMEKKPKMKLGSSISYN